MGPLSQKLGPIEEAKGCSLARPPFPQRGGGGLHRTPFWKTKKASRNSHSVSLIQPLDARPLEAAQQSLVRSAGQKLFRISKLCMKFLALIALINYYAQSPVKSERNMMNLGYARVSTNGQDLAAQEAELMAAGCAKVFKEKVSGAKTDRAELAKALRGLEPGDVLIVTRLDRLARSTRDLLNIVAAIAEREADFRSLKDTWADTTTPHGRLMLTVLGGLAEFERELIRARTGDGRARAKTRGVKFGRPNALTPHQRQEVMQRLAQGEAQADLARSYGVSQATISRLAAA
jgi:DNA invertase Pin-like site-specific DNA recombinase